MPYKTSAALLKSNRTVKAERAGQTFAAFARPRSFPAPLPPLLFGKKLPRPLPCFAPDHSGKHVVCSDRSSPETGGPL
jgi:hypothetical protein